MATNICDYPAANALIEAGYTVHLDHHPFDLNAYGNWTRRWNPWEKERWAIQVELLKKMWQKTNDSEYLCHALEIASALANVELVKELMLLGTYSKRCTDNG